MTHTYTELLVSPAVHAEIKTAAVEPVASAKAYCNNCTSVTACDSRKNSDTCRDLCCSECHAIHVTFHEVTSASADAAHQPQQIAEPASDLHQEAASRLADLIDIWDDRESNAPERRCYVSSAWGDTLAEARIVLSQINAIEAATPGEKS